MRKMKNLKGQKFGRLTAICPVAKNNLGVVLWLCDCDCGNDTIVEGRSLTSGATRSCGCLDREAHQFRPNRTTHGKSGTRIYRIWKKMKSRCSNPNDPDYQQYYGSRGITVCPEWLNDFQSFYEWAMSHGYSDELTIDRLDNDKGYSPENCRWATSKTQAINRNLVRNAKTITFHGESHTVREWAEITGINRVTIHSRIFKRGWDIERALTTTPSKKGDGSHS